MPSEGHPAENVFLEGFRIDPVTSKSDHRHVPALSDIEVLAAPEPSVAAAVIACGRIA
jgi:hypothetical protein